MAAILGAPSHHHGAVLGAAAGVLFGVPAVAVKALTNAASDAVFAVVGSPWLTIAAAGSARLPRLRPRVPSWRGRAVIACASTAAHVTCILVFGDALSGETVLLPVQIAAFALVAAAAL